MKNNYAKTGFTLVEILIAIVLLGLAVASLVASNIAFTQANGEGCKLSTAEFLIEQMREKTAFITYVDLGNTNPKLQTYKTESLQGLTGYGIVVNIQNVLNNNFGVVDNTGTSNFRRVTVTVDLNGRTINSGSWIRAMY